MDDDRWDEQVGSVAEEAQRLLESIRRAGGPADPAGAEDDGQGAGRGPEAPGDGPPRHAAPDPDEDGDGSAWTCTDPFCRSCPLCRTVAVVRGLSPETLRRLADLATVAAGVLSDLAGDRDPRDAHGGRADPPGAGTDTPPGATARTRQPSAPRPIPVRDADEGGSRG